MCGAKHDGCLIIAGHSHAEPSQPEIAGKFGKKRKIWGGFNTQGWDRHQADKIKAGLPGVGDQLWQVIDPASAFLRLIPDIDLNEAGRMPSGFDLRLGKRRNQRVAVDRVNDIEERDRILCLVRLELPDKVKLYVRKIGAQGWPFSLRFLHAVFAEPSVSRFEQRTNRGSVVGFRDGYQFDIIGMSARQFRRTCDICFHAGQPVLCVFVHPAAIGR